MSYGVTIRVGPKVTRTRVPSIEDAIDLLELELRALGPAARRAPTKVFARELTPAAQVSARGELSGPGRLRATVHAGADVRGDGSIEAYRGKLRREVVACKRGESPFDALRRVLGAS